jgi:hypothetical protein
VNVPVPDLQDAPAHQGSRLRVEVSPLIAYLLVRIHGLSMWVGSSRSEGLMQCHAADSAAANRAAESAMLHDVVGQSVINGKG